MDREIRISLVWALIGLGGASALAVGQVVERERDTKLTGPRGRTIERDIKVERGPGYLERQVEIKRPGETLIRDTRIQTGPAGRPFGGPAYGGPRYYGGPRFVENVIVQQPPVISGFVGLPALGFFFGGGGPLVPPPPLVIAVPPPQPPPVFDAFTDAIGRLKSFHAHSRRDGALTLGRIGDPRAIPALNERLEHDFDKDVRLASAWALGEIGDERGAVALERAVLTEKHHKDVRDAATEALRKLPRPGQVPLRASKPLPGTVRHAPTPSTVIPNRSRGELDPGPNPNPGEPGRIYPEDQPPPPPVPATAPARGTATRPTLEPPTNSGPFGNPS